MALREWRRVEATTIEYIVNTAHERGGVLSATSGQIAAYDTSVTPSSIVPIGILLEDIEAQNYMTHPQRYQRNVSDLGSKVGILTKGELETDMLEPAAEAHIDAGQKAYLTESGYLTIEALAPGVVDSNSDIGTSGVYIGRFISTVDSEGFARVRIDL
jgi:hypothetical protein